MMDTFIATAYFTVQGAHRTKTRTATTMKGCLVKAVHLTEIPEFKHSASDTKRVVCEKKIPDPYGLLER